MKKMILMLMAMVVFGNVLGGTWDWSESLEIKQLIYHPMNAFGTNPPTIFFTCSEEKNPGSDKWYIYEMTGENSITDDGKTLYAALLSAKNNGTKVSVFIETPNNALYIPFKSVRVLF